MIPIDPTLLALTGVGLPDAPDLPRDGWSERIDDVIPHGLTGLLADAWSNDLIDLDGDTIHRMSTQLEAEAIRAVRIEGELIRLADLVGSTPCVVLKGPVFAHEAYPDPQLRPFTDLDLLTTGDHFGSAVEHLEDLGYVRTRPEPAAGFDSRVGKATTLEHPGGVVVDLHRTLTPGVAGATIDVAELLAKRMWVDIGPIRVPAPSWEAHLVEAALHAVVGDGLARALSLRDVAQLATRSDLDATHVVDLARRWQVAGPVGAGLHVARAAFGLDLADDLGELATESVDSYPVAAQPDDVRSARRRLDELKHGDLRTRLILSRALLAPSPAFLRWTYGSQPLVSLYARRWVDLAGRVGDARSRPAVSRDAVVAPKTRLPEVAAQARRKPGTSRPTESDPPSPVALRERLRVGTVSVRRACDPSPDGEPANTTVARHDRWTRSRPPRATTGHQPPPETPAPTAQPDAPVDQTGRTTTEPPMPIVEGSAPAAATPAAPLPADNSTALILGGVALLTFTVLATQGGFNNLGVVTVPAAAICFAFAAARRMLDRHPDEAWVGRWLIAGVAVKLLASYARYFTLVSTYGGTGDATEYDEIGSGLADAWLNGGIAPELDDLRKTNFIRWFTGVVYYLFGTNMVAGFFVFGLLALAGSYFWYRATADAVPFLDKRIYLALVLFAPSIAFWPSSIGKEALMQLGIGVMAVGTSLLLRQRLLLGLAVGVAGGWLLWVVRPHLLALVTVAAGCAYLVGRVRPEKSGQSTFVGRPLGMLIVVLLVAFTVSEGADFLGLEDLSLSSIEAELDEQTEITGQGGSSFDNGGNSLNPINLPFGAVTVLLRPFPWETDSPLQLLASLESAALAVFIFMRLSSLKTALVRARSTPFLLYCWVLTLLYAATFSSFANFGILVRQRSLVLPALFVLLAVRPRGDPDVAVEVEPDRTDSSRAARVTGS